MASYWINLKDLPPAGEDYCVQEQAVWNDPIAEFGLPYTIAEAIQAKVHVSPQDKGYLINGDLSGKIEMPCDRCAEAAGFVLAAHFSIFEESDPSLSEADLLGPRFLWMENNVWFLDLAGVLWEQMVLNLPFKHVCAEECQGVCPGCGTNLNLGPCDCQAEEGDPRLAVLRRLKIE
ncbi:MAG: DUF177 domain-containing protein [Desulfohalobiaceae bacterium]|nr:DUF177 domain-containing protein [Desulfohalobiaceae bacterium]